MTTLSQWVSAGPCACRKTASDSAAVVRIGVDCKLTPAPIDADDNVWRCQVAKTARCSYCGRTSPRLKKPEEITRLCHAPDPATPAILAVFIQRMVLGKILHITRQDNAVADLPHRGLSCAIVPARFRPPAAGYSSRTLQRRAPSLWHESWGGRQPVSLMSWTRSSAVIYLCSQTWTADIRWAPYARNGQRLGLLKRSDFRRRV